MIVDIDIPSEHLPAIFDAYGGAIKRFAGLDDGVDLWDSSVTDQQRGDLLKAFLNREWRGQLKEAVRRYEADAAAKAASKAVAAPDMGTDPTPPDLTDLNPPPPEL